MSAVDKKMRCFRRLSPYIPIFERVDDMKPPVLKDEKKRLKVLWQYDVLD